MPRKKDPRKPVSVWTEKELLDGRVVDALVVILRTNGCSWSRKSGCLMCGYNWDRLDSVGPEDIIQQFDTAMGRHEGQPYIKIYTSGSFLDPGEVAPEAAERILSMAGKKAWRVLVESRPEFVNDSVDKALDSVKSLEVAIGLESASDEVRQKCVNKGFSFADYESACRLLQSKGAAVRTYLLLKPSYLTEREAVDDIAGSITKVAELSQIISVNPVNVQKGTVVESLWRKGLYRPPWLWSLIEVLKEANISSKTRLVSAPSGGGTRRGVHNCGKCDRPMLNAIQEFSLSQDVKLLKGWDCGCREEWLDWLELEAHAATTGDLSRLFRPQ